jgi:PEP-CTERM motif
MLARYLMAAFAAVGSMSVALTAQATVYDFSYTATFGVVSGMIIGTLQADNNTIDVTSITNPEFDGVPGPAVPVITTLADYFGLPGPTIPEVTLDGTNNNVLACTTSGVCGDGFYFNQAGVNAGYPQFAVGPSYSGQGMALYEPYDVTKWTISAAPEPATWTMMLAGMAGLGLAMRWRRKQPGSAATA